MSGLDDMAAMKAGAEGAEPKIALRERYRKRGDEIMRLFRWDLQLHFFWGFSLTLLGDIWAPLYAAGIVVTTAKEALDIWSKGFWSWGDFWWGLAGSAVALWHCGIFSPGTAG